MTAPTAKWPVCSIAAIACGLALFSVFFFLSTEEGRSFNERVFGRYYTLGALLVIGLYGAIALGLTGAGFVLALAAWMRRETPQPLRWLALASSVAAPLATYIFVKSLG